MGDAEEQKRMIMERKASEEGRNRLLSKESLSFGAQLRVGVESPPTNRAGPYSEPQGIMRDRTDTMTTNPLYGSSDKFVNPDGSMSLAGYSRGAHHDGIVNDPLRVDITDSMIANPVYGEHMHPRVPGVTGSMGLTSNNRSVSPLDDMLVANPLYGERQDLNPSQLPRKEMEDESKFTTNTDGGNIHSSDLDGRSIDSSETENTDGNGAIGGQRKEEMGHSEGRKDSPPCDREEVTSSPNRSSKRVKDSKLSIEKGSLMDSSDSQPSDSGVAGQSTPSNPHKNGSSSPSTSLSSDKGTTPVHTGHVTESTSPSSSDASVRASPTPTKGGTPTLANNGSRRGLSPVPSSASDKGASPIHSDHRGYSKVDKTRKAGAEEKGEGEGDASPPPPIPPRKYSNSDDS